MIDTELNGWDDDDPVKCTVCGALFDGDAQDADAAGWEFRTGMVSVFTPFPPVARIAGHVLPGNNAGT